MKVSGEKKLGQWNLGNNDGGVYMGYNDSERGDGGLDEDVNVKYLVMI